ncbi:MAG: DUF932 domain-containing protein [Betaproteobacteria bacterium]
MLQSQLPAAPLPPSTPRARALPAWLFDRSYRGELDDLLPRLPQFERVPFGAQGGIANDLLDTIVRRGNPAGGLPAVPVGVVSKKYQLLPHVEAATSVRNALGAIGVHPRDMQAETHLSTYGARMALLVRLPRDFDFDPGDRHPLALRIICLNSVDGSSRLRILLGWYRFVCANGLAVGTTRCEWRLVHREGAMPPDLAPFLQAGLQLARREQDALRQWVAITVPAERFAPFADENLAAAWGVRLAARFLHIVTTGFDAELAYPFEPGPASAKTLSPTRRVPGSPGFAQSAYDVAQALAWLARERKDPGERVERMLQIPELMQRMLGG